MKNAGLTKQNVAGCFCPITISSGVFTVVRYFGVLLMRGFGEGMKWFPNIRKKNFLRFRCQADRNVRHSRARKFHMFCVKKAQSRLCSYLRLFGFQKHYPTAALHPENSL